MKPACAVENIIKKSPLWEVTRHTAGDTGDIIETILYADRKSGGFVLPGVSCLEGKNQYETLKNVWAFVRYNLKYSADKPGHERVKSPGALFAIGRGDCKSYSIAIGALLRAFGIPFRYRFTAYAPGDVTHVYVVARIGSRPVILDAVHTKFDEEVNYYSKKDITPIDQKRRINGPGFSVDFSRWALYGVGVLLIYTVFAND